MESPFQLGTTTARELDEDVWPDILKRLPPKSVCRFRCVCRRWNSIILSPFFIHLYFSFNLSATPGNLKPYFQVYINEQFPRALPLYADNEQQIFHVPFQAVVEEGILDCKSYTVVQFIYDVVEKGIDCKSCTFVDVIHGVVCLVYNTVFCSIDDCLQYTFLWNPSVHKYLALPGHIYSDVGFGYDAGSDDFKVVMVSSSRGDSNISLSFDVCSARQGFWRPQETGIIHWLLDEDGHVSLGSSCFVNGTIHWLLVEDVEFKDNVYSMLMFDCESEKARTMDVCEQLGSCSKLEVVLFEYADMLAILILVDSQTTTPYLDLWVMEEHGVSTSLKKLYTVNMVYADLGFNGGGVGDFWFDLTIPCEIIMNDPSFEIEKRVPYGPNNQWITMSQILYNHIYNKSLFLMDYPKALSYTNQDVVRV